MNKEIKQLTELQVIDLQVAELNEKMSAEQAVQEQRQNAITEIQNSVAELKEKTEGLESRKRELEAELTDESGRIKERQSKMMQVQTNREYQSLLKEIEDGKKSNKDREDEIVQLMERVESLGKIMEEQVATCSTEEAAMAEESGQVESLIADLTSERNRVVKRRKAKTKGVNAGLLKRYDLLRERRNGRAVVGVDGGICQGCFMSLPPQHYNEVIRGERTLDCPTCQRILYYEEVVEKK